ncbi:MAG: cofactor-independent phosphoglycerate mutase [Candidatus Firestonebacteria bacterium]
MKYILIIPDGMADKPLSELGNKTPLQVAKKPNMDYLAKNSIFGMSKNIPHGFESGSDVAILSVLGYNPVICYKGRGPLEAASIGIKLDKRDVAFRCNLVTVKNNIMIDYSAGHISTNEAKVLIKVIDEKLGLESMRFYAGVSYRHLMVSSKLSDNIKCTPPHDIIDKDITKFFPKGSGESILKRLMEDSSFLLEGHEINRDRRLENKNPANMIWLWGAGKSFDLPSFSERFNVKGGIISAVDLVKGIAKNLNLDIINVPGITGYIDTNYSGKAEHCLKYLKQDKNDFCLIHIESTDETGHNGDVKGKIKAIEDIDEKIIGTLIKGLENIDDEYRIMICPDHPTPVSVRTHTNDPVPWFIYSSDKIIDGLDTFNEISASNGERINLGYKLIEKLFSKEKN